MALIGGSWVSSSWVSLTGWAANTWSGAVVILSLFNRRAHFRRIAATRPRPF